MTLARPVGTDAQYSASGSSVRTLYHITPTYDALGNVVETVTTLSQGTNIQVYDPRGAVRCQSGSLPIGEGYTGQRGTSSKPG